MKTLRFHYFMELRFSEPVREHRFTLKCFPQSGQRQRISELETQITPKESLSHGRDSFGNACVYGFALQPHRRFSVEVSGMAETGLAAREEAGEAHRAARFKYQTELTRPGPVITAFHDGLELSGSNLDRATACMNALYGRFRYVSGSTGICTTAEQAMAQGMGVCQDYAHILLSLCRLEGIPCRYIAGLLPGEGESHAWTEVYDGGGWVALDPTHNRRAEEGYIQFSAGRDSGDCSINRGVFTGQARQYQTIRAWAREPEEIRG